MATPEARQRTEKRGISNCMFCHAFTWFCADAACVLNICRSLVKLRNNHFILLLGCCDVLKKWGLLVSGRAISLQ